MLFPTGKTVDPYSRPDIQIITAGFGWNMDYGMGIVHNLWGHKDDFYTKVFLSDDNLEQYEVNLLVMILLRPKSRGTLRLRSTNPSELPLIDPNYLDEEDDVNTLAEAMVTLDKMTHTDSFRRYGLSHVVDTYNCGHHAHGSKAYRECFVR